MGADCNGRKPHGNHPYKRKLVNVPKIESSVHSLLDNTYSIGIKSKICVYILYLPLTFFQPFNFLFKEQKNIYNTSMNEVS